MPIIKQKMHDIINKEIRKSTGSNYKIKINCGSIKITNPKLVQS